MSGQKYKLAQSKDDEMGEKLSCQKIGYKIKLYNSESEAK